MPISRGVRVNERGQRIGESHPNAVLTDADVERLIADRGPEGAPALMTLRELAVKWGMSKSGVKGIIDGRRRGQVGPTVSGAPSQRTRRAKVRVNLRITLHARAKLHRIGGSVWLEKMIEAA